MTSRSLAAIRMRQAEGYLLGRPPQGIEMMRRGLDANRKMGIQVYAPGVLGTMARAQAELGNPEEGLATVEEALARVEATGERHWESEMHRTRGELLMGQGEAGAAEASLRKALDAAQKQGAKSWELRATMSLARLWRAQGRATEAHQRLAEVYGWFSEGFDTPDLVAARSLLDEMAGE